MSHPAKRLLLIVLVVSVHLFAAARASSARAAARTAPVAVPADGKTYYGVQLAWDSDTPTTYTTRLGKAPMVYGEYVPFPLDSTTKAALGSKVDQIRAARGS